jgi:hypothetical protein
MVQSEVEILKAEIKQLMAQKSTIEGEIQERTTRLNAPGQPGLTGSLMDKEVRVRLNSSSPSRTAATSSLASG